MVRLFLHLLQETLWNVTLNGLVSRQVFRRRYRTDDDRFGEPGIPAGVSTHPTAGLTRQSPQRSPSPVSGPEATSRASPCASSPCRLWWTEGRERMLQVVSDCFPVLTDGHRIRLLRWPVVDRRIEAAREVEDARDA